MSEPIIKKRKVLYEGMKNGWSAQGVIELLEGIDGIRAVQIDDQKKLIRLEYDLRKIIFESVENSLHEAGFILSRKIKERIKRGMAKFTEQNELDNLKVTPSSCHQDPKGNSKNGSGCH